MAYTKQWNNRPSAKRISNRQMRRAALAAIEQNKQSYAVLLTVLAQCGGEVTVGKEAISTVGKQLAVLRYDVETGVTGDYFVVRMTTEEDGNSDPTEIEHGHPAAGAAARMLGAGFSEDGTLAVEDDGSAGDSGTDAR